jgi:asparagine synthase (glutamine-hydrolysing)
MHHSRVQQRARYSRLLPRVLKQLVGNAAGFLATGTRGRSYLQSLAMPDDQAWVSAMTHFDRSTRRRLAPLTRTVDGSPPEAYRLLAGSRGRTLLQKMTRADFVTYLPEDILVKVDRASMLASLELRAPFLDYRIIEFAFGRVPDRLRATTTDRKILLKLLARRLLPPSFDTQRKQGFSLPLHTWFKGEWGSYIANVLRGAPATLFDPRAISDLLAARSQGFGTVQKLFNLAILELWRREYDIKIP